jgi:hypothetical protein
MEQIPPTIGRKNSEL